MARFKQPKYADVNVDLSECDSNAFAILGAVRKGLRRAGVSAAEIDEFTAEAKDGDYDHLIQTAMKWVNVE